MRRRNDVGGVDIPEGMDYDDARAAIKLLYGADQTYRSALRDFAKYENKNNRSINESTSGGANANSETVINSGATATTPTRRKRLRSYGDCENSQSVNDNDCQRRGGRITHLHVTGIASMFLPSWDLSFADVVRLDKLQSLKLNGCDSVPSELFFELPNLERLTLIHCQELSDPCSNSQIRKSSLRYLDIRGGGLWGPEFLSALKLLFPWMSSTLRSLSLTHTPYSSCYNYHKHYSAATTSTTQEPLFDNGGEEASDNLRRIDERTGQADRFHESMGRLLLDALLSLARGLPKQDTDSEGCCPNDNQHKKNSSPLEYLSLSFFNSLRDTDVASLLLDTLPEFPCLETLHLPHHTISNLRIASQTIVEMQKDYQLQPDLVVSSNPHIVQSSCLSWRQSRDLNSITIASVSRLRRLWLRPTLWHRIHDDNDDGQEILLALLSHFPELSCVARSSSQKGYLYSPCVCCSTSINTNNPNHHSSSLCQATSQTIEYLLRMNHSGRCLLEGLEEGNNNENPHPRLATVTSSPPNKSRERRSSCKPSVWPLVLERAWKVPPPDFCLKASCDANNASAIFHLLREGPILSHLA